MKLPERTEHSPTFRQMNNNIGCHLIFIGYATLSATLKNATEQESPKTSSYENRMEEFKNGIEIEFHDPAHHNCSHCDKTIQHHGKHIDWCYSWPVQCFRIVLFLNNTDQAPNGH